MECALLFSGDREMIPVGDFQIIYDNKTKGGEHVFIRRLNVTIKWPGGRTGPPRDSPECGFHGELCIKPMGEGATLLMGHFLVALKLIPKARLSAK